MSKKSESEVDKTFAYLCSQLNYVQKNGLVESDSDAKDESQRYIFKQVSEKLGIDAVFFLRTENEQSIPLIYFHKLESVDHDVIAELHKQVWNMGQAPLLFIILPDVVLIYNAYEQPKILQNGELDYEAGFIEDLKVFVNAKKEFDKLKKYRSSELLTGNYWQKYSKHFNDKNRVYQTLLDNLEFMRSQLLKKGLPPEFIHNLLTRSIFIKYLEDRTDNNGHNVFPKGFFSKFLPNATNFTGASLSGSVPFLLRALCIASAPVTAVAAFSKPIWIQDVSHEVNGYTAVDTSRQPVFAEMTRLSSVQFISSLTIIE